MKNERKRNEMWEQMQRVLSLSVVLKHSSPQRAKKWIFCDFFFPMRQNISSLFLLLLAKAHLLYKVLHSCCL